MRYEAQPSNHDRAWWAAPCVTDWQSAPSTWQHYQSASSSIGHDKVIFTLLNRGAPVEHGRCHPVPLRRNPMVGAHTERNGSRTCAVACCGGSRTVDACCCCSTRHRTACDPCGDVNKAPTATLKEAYEKCAAPPFQKDGVLWSEYPMKLNDTSLTLKIFKWCLKSSLTHSDAQGVLLVQITSEKVRTRTCTLAKHAHSFLCFFTCDNL